MKIISMTLLEDRVAVLQDEPESVSKGGIALPDSATEKPRRGEVVATGPGKMMKSGDRAPMDIACGDHVIFTSYAGQSVEVGGEEILILYQGDILAVL